MPLTPAALVLLLLPALMALVAPEERLAFWLGPLAFGGVILLLLGDYFISRRGVLLELERLVQHKLSLNATNLVKIRLHNRSAKRLSLLIKDDVPPAFETSTRLFRLTLAPFATATLSYSTRPLARGRYEFGDVYVRGLSRLGLSYWQLRISARQSVSVYPNIWQVRHYELLARQERLGLAGFRPLPLWGAGTEFESLRDYVPDDDFRVIDWKATARRHRPVSRQFEIERRQNIWLMIDAGRLMSTQIGALTRLDYALNAAVMLAYVALRQGDAVGLVAFADTIKAYVPLNKGPRQLRLLLEALHDLQPVLAESDYAAAFQFLASRSHKRVLCVCFTDVIDVHASRRLLEYLSVLSPRHLPLLISLRDSELEHMARRRPQDIRQTYERALAAQILQERETALGILRQRGVMVLDVPPETLSLAAVNQYLKLKALGRL